MANLQTYQGRCFQASIKGFEHPSLHPRPQARPLQVRGSTPLRLERTRRTQSIRPFGYYRPTTAIRVQLGCRVQRAALDCVGERWPKGRLIQTQGLFGEVVPLLSKVPHFISECLLLWCRALKLCLTPRAVSCDAVASSLRARKDRWTGAFIELSSSGSCFVSFWHFPPSFWRQRTS